MAELLGIGSTVQLSFLMCTATAAFVVTSARRKYIAMTIFRRWFLELASLGRALGRVGR